MTNELYNEKYRPQFHFTPKAYWMNDPNGLVYYQGEYHLFFQHNPAGNQWGNMTWGHAISTDLVHWQQLPDAIQPDQLGTVFSGSAVVDWHNLAGFQTGSDNTLVAIYTAAGGTSEASHDQPFTQCICFSNDRGRTWTKYDGNPVLSNIAKENRDPKVIWHAPSRHWIMVLYLDGNNYAFFRSLDLKHWTHLHDITVPGCSECPDFFELPLSEEAPNTRWIFTAANGKYLIGTFDGNQFIPESDLLQVDYGPNYYAVQTYSDVPVSDDRRIQLAWMAGGKYPDMPFNQQMSFPCQLTLHRLPDGLRLLRYPVHEIDTVHTILHHRTNISLAPDVDILDGITGSLYDISAEFDWRDNVTLEFTVYGERIVYSTTDGQLTCLGRSISLRADAHHLSLRILVDRTSLEVFVNDGIVSMTGCYLPVPGASSLHLVSHEGTVNVKELSVYELQSAWR